jgi:DHA1 family tetracycline resistance protein-like MFS transporter
MSFFKARAHGRASLIFIAITVGLDILSQSIAFPILPRLAQLLLGGDRPAAARWIGWLEVAWVVPQFFAAPVLGVLSDRFGRRPVIIASVFGVGAEAVMGALAPSIWWLFTARILCGLTCGGMAAAMAYVADVTAPEERTRAYARTNAAIWAAIVIGPALGGLLSATGDLRAPFWAAAVFAAAAGAYGLFVLPESVDLRTRAPLRWSKANPWGALGLFLHRPGLAVLGVAQLLLWLAAYANQSVQVLYTAFRYGWDALAFGAFCSAFALANIAVQVGLAGCVARRIGERGAIIIGLTAQALSFAAMALAPTGLLYCAASLPQLLGNIAGPSLQSLMTARVAADEQGRLQGAVGAISTLAGFSGSIVFTQAFAWTVSPGRPIVWSGGVLVVGAGLTLAALALAFAFARERRPVAA